MGGGHLVGNVAAAATAVIGTTTNCNTKKKIMKETNRLQLIQPPVCTYEMGGPNAQPSAQIYIQPIVSECALDRDQVKRGFWRQHTTRRENNGLLQ